MKGWLSARNSRLRRQKGGQIIEYSLLLSLVVIVCIGGINAISHGTRRTFCAVLVEKSVEEVRADSNYNETDGTCRADAAAGGTQFF